VIQLEVIERPNRPAVIYIADEFDTVRIWPAELDELIQSLSNIRDRLDARGNK
jgi:hypothetical protein